ncbi:uncharacterized protein MYCFIDRAFT_170311 [Pseudocercospora fijiensis CIRAD86]|uniref:Uncharacterized protein n=1 Tax=Pseudocercospora fijiensis (strain CIRAD86) TaxID=383855 RepID=N1QAA5_PSEFD|nr:uncharacterized protein MYCFIDRAFT_170311 [Pseudocercospora fijiensis CIRAD86]EME88726.1 hypothetical protein MYCFIDRAFT_170311 [Pseudocercospora fijiensis CIRAD86]
MRGKRTLRLPSIKVGCMLITRAGGGSDAIGCAKSMEPGWDDVGSGRTSRFSSNFHEAHERLLCGMMETVQDGLRIENTDVQMNKWADYMSEEAGVSRHTVDKSVRCTPESLPSILLTCWDQDLQQAHVPGLLRLHELAVTCDHRRAKNGIAASQVTTPRHVHSAALLLLRLAAGRPGRDTCSRRRAPTSRAQGNFVAVPPPLTPPFVPAKPRRKASANHIRPQVRAEPRADFPPPQFKSNLRFVCNRAVLRGSIACYEIMLPSVHCEGVTSGEDHVLYVQFFCFSFALSFLPTYHITHSLIRLVKSRSLPSLFLFCVQRLFTTMATPMSERREDGMFTRAICALALNLGTDSLTHEDMPSDPHQQASQSEAVHSVIFHFNMSHTDLRLRGSNAGVFASPIDRHNTFANFRLLLCTLGAALTIALPAASPFPELRTRLPYFSRCLKLLGMTVKGVGAMTFVCLFIAIGPLLSAQAIREGLRKRTSWYSWNLGGCEGQSAGDVRKSCLPKREVSNNSLRELHLHLLKLETVCHLHVLQLGIHRKDVQGLTPFEQFVECFLGTSALAKIGTSNAKQQVWTDGWVMKKLTSSSIKQHAQMSAEHPEDPKTTATQNEMPGQPGLRNPFICKDPVPLSMEHPDQRGTPNKRQAIFSDTDCSPGLTSPTVFDPEALRTYSDTSPEVEDRAVLSTWETSKSKPNVLDEIETRQDSLDRVPRQHRRSSLVSVEIEYWSREYDPADPDNYDEGISPTDMRGVSPDSQNFEGQNPLLETLFLNQRRPKFSMPPNTTPPSRPKLNVYQPGPPLKGSPLPPHRDPKHSHSRNDTRVTKLSDYGIHPPKEKSGRWWSISRRSSDKSRIESRDGYRPSRCGLLPSLPESIVEQSLRPTSSTLREFRTSGDPLESRIWERDSRTAYDVMRKGGLKSKSKLENENENRRGRSDATAIDARSWVQAWLDFEDFGPASWERGGRLVLPSAVYYAWWAMNLGVMGSTIFCFVYAASYDDPGAALVSDLNMFLSIVDCMLISFLQLGVLCATIWLTLLAGACLWWRRSGIFEEQTECSERSPLLSKKRKSRSYV